MGRLELTDSIVLIVYLLAMVLLGASFARKGRSSEHYFVGNRSMPWWAVGISIFATQLSAITYIAVPGRAYETDWSWVLFNMGIPIVGIVVIYLFLPLYRKNKITSIYQYLEDRFSVGVRTYGAMAFLLMQVGRVAVVLYLPALVLHEVTGAPVIYLILAMGILATLYTVLGGIEAVVWTDVIQAVVLLGGALLALWTISSQIDGGVQTIIKIGEEHEKFNLVHWDASQSQDVIWFILIGAFFTNLVPYASDQTVIQRYFTLSSDREARNSLWLSVMIVIPTTLLFFSLGSALFAFYQTHPGLLEPSIEWDRVFPFFIVNQMPSGIIGLLIAAIFAGSMSSLDSSLNSISTVLVTDFYQRFTQKEHSEQQLLNLARWATVGAGAVATILAVWVANRLLSSPDQKGAWDFFLAVQGVLGGGLAGVFCAGALTKRTHSTGVFAGLIASALAIAVAQYYLKWHTHTFAAVGILTALAVSWSVSVLIPFKKLITLRTQ